MRTAAVLALTALTALLVSSLLAGDATAAAHTESNVYSSGSLVATEQIDPTSSEAGNEVPPSAALAAAPEAARGTLALIAAAVAVPLLVVGGGVVYTSMPGTSADRRRKGAVPEEAYDELLRLAASRSVFPLGSDSATPEVAPPADVDVEAAGWLRHTENGHGAAQPVNGHPVIVGYSSDCDLVLPSRGAQRRERVRVWQSSGRFMLRNLNGSGNVRVADRPVAWQVLEDGDAIEVGDCIVRFEAPASPDLLTGSSGHAMGSACPANAIPA